MLTIKKFNLIFGGSFSLFLLFIFLKQPLLVTEIIDGDTLKLSDGRMVDLLGVDAPELVFDAKAKDDLRRTGYDPATLKAMGEKARGVLKDLVEGFPLHLEFDKTRKAANGHILAYVYADELLPLGVHLPKQGGVYIVKKGFWRRGFIFVNATMVSSGIARRDPQVKIKYAALYDELYAKVAEEIKMKQELIYF